MVIQQSYGYLPLLSVIQIFSKEHSMLRSTWVLRLHLLRPKDPTFIRFTVTLALRRESVFIIER